GLLLELKFSEMSSRFDSNPSPHINVICPNCGEIYDYEVKSIETFWSQIASELRKKPTALRFDFYTICNKCSKL
ncbi:MAG: transcriptional repressor, partial [Candidatus Hodarchaeota archaeon]